MLLIVGALKTKITGETKLRGAIEMLIIGFIAFVVSYGIGLALEQLMGGI